MEEIRSREMERHILAAAEHLLMALKETANDDTNQSLADDAWRVFSDLQSRILAKPVLPQRKEELFKEAEERLKRSEDLIMNWETNHLTSCDSGPAECEQYLEAVVVIQRSIESLGTIYPFRIVKQKDILFRADQVLEIALSRLQEEVKRILGRFKQTYEPNSVMFRSHTADSASEESVSFIEADSADLPGPEDNTAVVLASDCAVDLIQPDMIPVLRSVAKVMFDYDHGQEFRLAFIGARRDALREHLACLELKQLSIEEILSLDWDVLSREIRNWVRAMKITIGVYLVSERNLCNQILGEFGETASAALFDIAKSSILLLLNFGEAVVASPHWPEKLFGVLDMYEVLANLIISVDVLFSEEERSSSIRIEFHDLLAALGDYSRATFSKFRDSIKSNRSQKPFTKGGVDPLTSYAMNYINTLCAYRATFDVLFRDEQVCFMCPSLAAESMADDDKKSPLERHLRSILPVLESNLKEKSALLKPNALQHIFWINNISYMVDKVKESDDLRLCFGDEWIRKQNTRYQQHATSYLRATWRCASSILLESTCSPGSSTSNARTISREKCRVFCTAFEEVYKLQTGWLVPNPRLRSDLHNATSQQVITGYRTFLGKHKYDIGDKYAKYTADDMEKLVLDFFEGLSKPLPHAKLRWK